MTGRRREVPPPKQQEYDDDDDDDSHEGHEHNDAGGSCNDAGDYYVNDNDRQPGAEIRATSAHMDMELLPEKLRRTYATS